MASSQRRRWPAIVFRRRRVRVRRTDAREIAPLVEWRSLVALRPNIMIEGQESDVEKTLVALTGDFRRGTCEWNTFDAAADGGVTAIVVREVTRLSADERARLQGWLDRQTRRVQLIATSSTPVFDSVEQGLFAPELYYRLNTVRILAQPHAGAA